MLEKNHNDNSKQFMQKVLMFIDTVLVNASAADQDNVNKVLVGGLLNVRDAIFSEIVRDNQVAQFNQFLQQQEEAKKNQEEKDLKDSSQETELDKDLQA
jgi:membrane protein involved in colicin uptake